MNLSISVLTVLHDIAHGHAFCIFFTSALGTTKTLWHNVTIIEVAIKFIIVFRISEQEIFQNNQFIVQEIRENIRGTISILKLALNFVFIMNVKKQYIYIYTYMITISQVLCLQTQE